jgi:hypothetical protein
MRLRSFSNWRGSRVLGKGTFRTRKMDRLRDSPRFSAPSLQRLVRRRLRSGACLSRRKQWASAFFELFSFGAFGFLSSPPHFHVQSSALQRLPTVRSQSRSGRLSACLG